MQEKHALGIIGIFVAYLLILSIHTVLYVRGVFIRYTTDSIANELRVIRMVTDEEKKKEAILLAQNVYPGISYTTTDHMGIISTGLYNQVSDNGYAVKFEKTDGDARIVFVYRMDGEEERYVVGIVPFISVIDNKAGRIQLILCAQTICMIIAVFIIGWSLTSSKKRREEIRKAETERERAEAADRAKSDFVANISHEIRTPINAILGLNEMIKRESRDEGIRHYAADIATAGEQLLSLVNDILDYSKIESGNMQIVETEYDIKSLLYDVCKVIEIRSTLKGLEFEYNIDHTTPMFLVGDKMHIQQILFNLLTNAVKYTEKGHITLGVWYQMDPEDADRLILNISVKDTGIGIRAEDTESIFGRFQRTEEGQTSGIEGSGLGLSITKDLVQKMGGEIHLQSEYGQGSLFVVRFPQRIASMDPIRDFALNTGDSKENEKMQLYAPEVRLLVVDDTELNLTVIQNLLKRTGIQVNTALSGKEAIDIVNSVPMYDIILLDARMPGLNGKETLSELKAHKDLCPVICLTADVVDGAREDYLSNGFSDYLAKPVKASELERAIAEHCDKKKISFVEEISVQEISDIPEWIMDIREIDIESGIGFCGSANDYLEAIKTFVKHAPDSINEIRSHIDNENTEDLTTKVHSLKSTAKTIGAERLSEIAKNMEQAAKDKDMDYVHSHIGTLLSLYGELSSALSPILYGEGPQKKGVTIEKSDTKSVFAHLKGYVDDYNDEAVDSMLHALDRYDFPPEEQKIFDDLKKTFEMLDWLMMQDILKGY